MITTANSRELLLVIVGILSITAMAARLPGIPAAADRLRIVHGLG